MTTPEVSKLWWSAMDMADHAERHILPPAKERKAWQYVRCTATLLLQKTQEQPRHKPPGIEEMLEEAARHLQ